MAQISYLLRDELAKRLNENTEGIVFNFNFIVSVNLTTNNLVETPLNKFEKTTIDSIPTMMNTVQSDYYKPLNHKDTNMYMYPISYEIVFSVPIQVIEKTTDAIDKFALDLVNSTILISTEIFININSTPYSSQGTGFLENGEMRNLIRVSLSAIVFKNMFSNDMVEYEIELLNTFFRIFPVEKDTNINTSIESSQKKSDNQLISLPGNTGNNSNFVIYLNIKNTASQLLFSYVINPLSRKDLQNVTLKITYKIIKLEALELILENFIETEELFTIVSATADITTGDATRIVIALTPTKKVTQ
jgi:hypothetical protein